MGNFRSEDRGGFGGRSFGGRDGGSRGFGDRGRSFGGRDGGRFERRPVEMHDAVCDKCKKHCQVPFKPSGDKPIYCSDCFKESGGSGSRGKPSQSGVSSEQFNKLNAKLDKIIAVLQTLEIDSGENEGVDDLADDLDENAEEEAEDNQEIKPVEGLDEEEDDSSEEDSGSN
ncbi:MAG TPA: CxxC-x17-CxxC domain-containing protein [Candidatus Nanoarchaeia archaeon]|nr:CxxC-x17-CxxC domain-containing protein [Candidatus Nanoarchaeia archaeon]